MPKTPTQPGLIIQSRLHMADEPGKIKFLPQDHLTHLVIKPERHIPSTNPDCPSCRERLRKNLEAQNRFRDKQKAKAKS